MGKVVRPCAWCGMPVIRYPSQFKNKTNVFCDRKCQHCYETKALNPDHYQKDFSKSSEFLKQHNAEFNKNRMTEAVRAKVRASHLARGRNNGKTYAKLYGRHEHRIVAEEKIGRKLKPGEVVHHIDGNKRNNSPDNLIVFSSQAEHAAFHASQRVKVGEVI